MTSTTSSVPSSTPPAPPASPTPTNGGGGGGGGGPTSSPLLFFVALGFGVVFTNLWIIVGVKYCFRYNQRNRRPQHDDNGEPIDLVTMPHGPRRRRREKKLMTMDEVNERFPLLKYKAWMTSRAAEGLPTAGGVAAPTASRAASLRNVEGTVERKSSEQQRPTTPTSATKPSMDQKDRTPDSTKEGETKKPTEESKPAQAQDQPAETPSKSTDNPNLARTRTHDTTEEDDEDDQIQMAVPTEMMATPGDSCAICIDTLEDDDDVRGLSCGHAFHASCLDPWLTSRRACCPLCKADYYVPKPRPEGEAQAEDRSGRRRADMPAPPQDAFLGGRANRIRFMPARFMFLGNDGAARGQHGADHRDPNRQNRNNPSTAAETPAPSNQQPAPRRFAPFSNISRPHIRVPNFMRLNAQPQNATTTNPSPETAATTTTPSQLEAGQR